MPIMDELKIDWTSEDYYNFEDLNRVESATLIVKDQILYIREIDISVEAIENRTQSSIEFADSLNRIEDNILRLKQTFPDTSIFNPSKTDWFQNDPFDYTDANRLEQDLHEMYHYFRRNIEAIPYCGQYTTGQEGVY